MWADDVGVDKRGNQMNAIGQRLVATRVLAGVVVPDTPVISRAIDYAREHHQPYLFNHVMRSWLFSVAIAGLRSAPHDPEVLAVATLLHDLGLEPALDGPLRFEVEGANAARAFARAEGMGERQAQLVWDGVALNSTPSIGLHKESEVSLCTTGIGLDWGGWGRELLTEDRIRTILDAFPRLGMKQCFTRSICRIVERRPETTYDNFARDFGERFIPSYKSPSTVDFLLSAPFDE